MPTSDRDRAGRNRAVVLMVASVVAPLVMIVAFVALEGSAALPVVLGVVAALALLTAWVTSGVDDRDEGPRP